MSFAFCIRWIGVGQDDKKAVAALSIAASVALFVVLFLPPALARAR
jgi:hypothetical protein